MVVWLVAWTYPFLGDGGAVRADDELLRGGGEVGQPAD